MEIISRKDRYLIWLSGLIDGDGCVSLALQKSPLKRNSENEYLVPYVAITTTCTTTKNHIADKSREFEIPIYIRLKKQPRNDLKPVWEITVRGLGRVKNLLSQISSYLITKSEEAELLLKFIAERESLQFQKKRGPTEQDILRRLKEIKRQRNTVRNPQRLYAEPIQGKI